MPSTATVSRHGGRTRTLPDFLVIGAAKAGTSALFRYMAEHPQIFMPRKEIRFFAYDAGEEARERMKLSGSDHFAVRTLADYQALFADADPAKAWGEVAPLYLESPSAPRRIRELVPGVRLIASLRNPVKRAFSGFVMQVRAGREHRDLREAFDEGAHYVRASFYYPQVKRYLDLFPREQLLLFRYEDFLQDNEAILRRVFGFVGVDPAFRPALGKRHNVSTYPRSRFLNSLIENRFTREVLRPRLPKWTRRLARAAKSRNLGDVPEMPREIEARLHSIFDDDIARLQDLTGLDLSSWRQPPARL